MLSQGTVSYAGLAALPAKLISKGIMFGYRIYRPRCLMIFARTLSETMGADWERFLRVNTCDSLAYVPDDEIIRSILGRIIL